MNVEFVDIEMLSASLLTVAAVVMVLVDLIKMYVKAVGQNAKAKYLVSLILSILITAFAGISLFETESTATFYVGVVAAGFIASLGANVIHELMKVLQTVKTLKKDNQKK